MMMVRVGAFLVGLVCLFLFAACGRSEYNNRFSTPVSKIDNRYIELADGRDVRIPAAKDEETTIFVLVRHAEKAGGDDPELTERGRRRAEKLASVLSEMELDEIYASPYERTRQTAQPVAEAKNMKITPYDASRLEDFLDMALIRNRGQRVLIVGHSNTTPALLNFLTGREQYAQIPDEDYDNLYLVAIEPNGKINIFELRLTME